MLVAAISQAVEPPSKSYGSGHQRGGVAKVRCNNYFLVGVGVFMGGSSIVK